MPLLLKAAILGVVEGVTEFLPISSTGHLIIVNRFLEFQGAFAEMFDIVIQLGAILAVVAHFRKKLLPSAELKAMRLEKRTLDIWLKCAAAVVPALIVGFLCGKWVQAHLFTPFVVAGTLIAGGAVLIGVESFEKKGKIDSVEGISYKLAIAIGTIQCLAILLPGTSRSAATIIGAMLLGASRPAAAEFSFYLAIPTMAAASAYSLMKHAAKMSVEECAALGIGFAVSFFVAWAAIALFMRYIQSRDFKPFGYYRIVLGAAVLAYFHFAGQ